MQLLETDAEGKGRKRRCFQLLTEELPSWIKNPRGGGVGGCFEPVLIT
jgi:hypothetical protein